MEVILELLDKELKRFNIDSMVEEIRLALPTVLNIPKMKAMRLSDRIKSVILVFRYSHETRHCECGKTSWPVFKFHHIEVGGEKQK